MTNVFIIITPCPLVDIVKCEQAFLLARLGIDGITCFNICLDQLLAPPRQPHVLWSEVGVVVAAVVQILKCKKLILCTHRCRDQNGQYGQDS